MDATNTTAGLSAASPMDVDDGSSAAAGAAAGQAAKPLKMVEFASADDVPAKFRMYGELPEAFTGKQLQPKGKQSSKYKFLLLDLDDKDAAFELAKQQELKKRTVTEPRRYACLVCVLAGEYRTCFVKCTDTRTGKFKMSPYTGHMNIRRAERNKVGDAHQRWWDVINPSGTRTEARLQTWLKVSRIGPLARSSLPPFSHPPPPTSPSLLPQPQPVPKVSIMGKDRTLLLDTLIPRWLAKRARPLNLLCDPELNEIFAIASKGGYTLPGSQKAQRWIVANSDEIKEEVCKKVKETLEWYHNGKPFTAQGDLWTSDADDDYFALSITFIPKGALASLHVLLACRPVGTSHTAANLAKYCERIFAEFGFTSANIWRFVTDNAYNIAAMPKLLKPVPVDHDGCKAHTIDLAVNDALDCGKNANTTEKKWTTSRTFWFDFAYLVGHFHHSAKGASALRAIQEKRIAAAKVASEAAATAAAAAAAEAST